MGGVIAMAGDRVHMTDASQLMIHNPWGGDPDDENTQKALSALRDSLLVTINNRAKVSEKKISGMMNDETWINPTDALKWGLIDEIVPTKKQKKQTKEAKAAVAEYFNKYNNNNKNDMKNIAEHFGLQSDASEAAILKAAQTERTDFETSKADLITANTTVATLTEDKVELEAKIVVFEESAEEVEAAIVKETLETAVEQKIFKKESVEGLTVQFKGKSVELKAVIGSMSTKAPNISGLLKGKTGDGIKSKLSDSLLKMSYVEADKADKLATIKDLDEPYYFALYKEQYNKNHPDFVEEV